MLDNFILYDTATGAVALTGRAEAGIQSTPPGWAAITIAERTDKVEDIPLATLKSALWDWVKGKREAVIAAGAPTPIGVVQTDDVSRTNLNGATLGALLMKSNAQPFSMTWTDASNGVHQLNADQMIAVGLAAMQFVSAAHARSLTLRVAIETATDLTALLTIPVTSEWPANTGAA